MAAQPTQEDAKLLLELYDLRREKVLRRARDFVQQRCKFKDYKDFEKRYPEGTKQRNYVAMALGYWATACTLVDKGLLHEDLFQSTNFEHVNLWFKFKPVVEGWRRKFNYPDIMRPLEAVASRHPAAPMFQQPAKSKTSKSRVAKVAEQPVEQEAD